MCYINVKQFANTPYNCTSCSNFAKNTEALDHSLQILHMKGSITLFNCFLHIKMELFSTSERKERRDTCIRKTYSNSDSNISFREDRKMLAHSKIFSYHTKNSSGVACESHVGMCIETIFTPSTPLTLTDA